MNRTPHAISALGVAVFASAALAATVTVFGPQIYTRGPGRPVDVTRTFVVNQPKGNYTLRVNNDGVTSAEVVLNGKKIFDRDDFTKRDRDRDRDWWDRYPWDRDRWDRHDWDRWDRDDPDRHDRDRDDRDRDRKRPVRRLEEQVKLKNGTNKIAVTIRSRRGTSLSVEIFGQGTTGTDTTAPTISAAVTPAPNASGWNNTPVTVTFTCADNSGAVASCTAPITVNADTPAQIVSGTATDQAGNSANASVTVRIDRVAPVVTATRSPVANANGWNNTPVVVTFVATDATSGISAGGVTAPITLAAEGSGLSVTGQAVDLAGNTATATAADINIDRVAPQVFVELDPLPGGWVRQAVTVSFRCEDGGSGVAACPDLQELSADGGHQTISGTATDLAGNTAGVTSPPVDIDRTPPAIAVSLTPAANAAGWHNSPVSVAFTCTDGSSGVVGCPASQQISVEGPDQVFSAIAADAAGNQSNVSVEVDLDTTPPEVTLTSPAADGRVFNAAAVLTGTLADPIAGVAQVTCDGAPALVVADTFSCSLSLAPGANVIPVAVTDRAGNISTATRTLTYLRAPTVTFDSPANLSYLNISPTTVTGTVDDPTATVAINSLTAPVVNGRFSIALPIAEGTNVIAATATSAAGAIGTASLEVTLDTTPPHVRITSPIDGFVTAEGSISVTGTVNDIVVGTVNDLQAQVTINGVAAEVANRTFLVRTVTLAEGANVIQAVGRDRVGNAVTSEITVVRQAAGQPRIRVISGNNQDAPVGGLLAAPLVVELVDAIGAPIPGTSIFFKVLENDGEVTTTGAPAATAIATTDQQGRAQAQWKIGHRSGAGINRIDAYAVGVGGTALFTATGIPGAPGRIVVDVGNDQVAAVSQVTPRPFVAVVVDSGHNRLPGVPVTFTVREGGGSFNGESSVTVESDSDGRVSAMLTMGPFEGRSNNVAAADFASNTGLPATFTASGRIPGDPAQTSVSGVVLDNSNLPIAGVMVRAVSTHELYSSAVIAVQSAVVGTTDERGQFVIPGAPVGLVKVLVDGSTAQRPGTYPSLEYDIVTVAGQDHSVGQPIYLLPLSTENQLCVSPTDGGGTLTMADAPGFSLTFAPGQVTFPGGSKTGCISVTAVNSDKVPMSPAFGQQPRFIVTIQPSGAHFEPPAALTIPNVDGLKPREITEMYSYDHDLSAFVAIGTGTVSNDGLVIRSNPGVGVLKSGWHGAGNPNQTGTAATCPQCRVCVGDECKPDLTQNGNTPCKDDICKMCENGDCVPRRLKLTITAPPDNPNPSDSGFATNFSFLSTDTLAATAALADGGDLATMTWTLTPGIGQVQDVQPTNKRGPTLQFKPAPPTHPFNNDGAHGSVARSMPLSYLMAANFCSASATTTIKQDQIDIVRQEYVGHGIDVPERAEFATPVATSHFSVPEMNITSYSVVVGNPGPFLESIRASYNRLINDDLQVQPLNQTGLAPTAVVVSPGATIQVTGALLDTLPCEGGPNPTGCDDVIVGTTITAGPNGIAETRARNATTDFGLTVNSTWRNPERNENKKGALRSRHQYGNAVDLSVITNVPGKTRAQLYCILQTAGDLVADAFAEQGPTQLACNLNAVSHVHVQQ